MRERRREGGRQIQEEEDSKHGQLASHSVNPPAPLSLCPSAYTKSVHSLKATEVALAPHTCNKAASTCSAHVRPSESVARSVGRPDDLRGSQAVLWREGEEGGREGGEGGYCKVRSLPES